MSTHAYHGGASFDAIGVAFDALDSRSEVVDADVLDAWYDPAPGVISGLSTHLAWLVKTSPPTHADGLRRVLAEARGLDPEQILLGGGTSFLMFLALPRLLPQKPKVLVLDPCYGEYPHLVEEVLGGELIRLPLLPENSFDPDIDELIKLAESVDMVILVNPNSPTGRVIPLDQMVKLADSLKPSQKLWIDETYIDFAPGVPSFEPHLSSHPNVIVAKSLSKYYALSGLRIGCLEMDPSLVSDLSRYSPPWSVGLPAQLAGVEALKDPKWYEEKVVETRKLREHLAGELSALPGVKVTPSSTNFVLLDFEAGDASDVAERVRKENVFLRDCDSLTKHLKGRLIRTAVKDSASNQRIISALRQAIR